MLLATHPYEYSNLLFTPVQITCQNALSVLDEKSHNSNVLNMLLGPIKVNKINEKSVLYFPCDVK